MASSFRFVTEEYRCVAKWLGGTVAVLAVMLAIALVVAIILGSSVKSMGEFWLRKLAKYVI
jgi:hypothetical protein